MDPARSIRRRVRSVDDEDGAEFRLTNWSPATDRHEAFPPSAPFLPSVPIMTIERARAALMAMTCFSHLPEGDGGIERLLAEGRAGGWEDLPMPVGLPSMLATTRMQRRGVMTRCILKHEDKNAPTSP